MNNDGKDDEARDGGEPDGVEDAGENANGTHLVPGAYLYPRAVRVELGERMQRIGAELRGLGDALIETGGLFPQVEGSAAAIAAGGIRIEIRYLRDLMIELENNL